MAFLPVLCMLSPSIKPQGELICLFKSFFFICYYLSCGTLNANTIGYQSKVICGGEVCPSLGSHKSWDARCVD